MTVGTPGSVLRGGSWNNNENNVRAANRNRNEPTNRNNNIGFRCARPLSRFFRDIPTERLYLAGMPRLHGGAARAKKVSAGDSRPTLPSPLSLGRGVGGEGPGKYRIAPRPRLARWRGARCDDELLKRWREAR